MNKKLLTVISSLVLAGCAATATPPQNAGLTFIHLNDTYRVDAVEDDSRGGFSRVVTLVRELQAQGREVHITHGGDFLYPSLESQLWKGLQIVDAMNFLNGVAPIYAAIGNHEFDPRSAEPLINAIQASEFVWLGDNVEINTGDPQADAAVRSAFTFEAGGKTIGVFSVTLHPDDGGYARDYVSFDRDYKGTAERTIKLLERRGVDLIIGVTHVHMWQDVAMAELKAEHPKLAFVVGGHEHEPQYFYIEGMSAPVMKGASNARVIWQIDVDFDASGAYTVNETRVDVDESIAFDPEYEVIVEKWKSRLLEKYPFLEARIGTAALTMDAREEQVRSRETSWGNFIADRMRTAFGEPDMDLAFFNGGTLRLDDLVEDDIRFEDIGRTFGYSSFLRHTTVSGAEFIEIMEAGFRGGPESQGYFPQVSGFRVCVDRSLPEFDRIVSLQVPADDGWADIEAGETYTLVVPDFIYGGGDGYEIPKDRFASRPASELKYLVLDEIIRAQGEGRAVGEPITRDNRRTHILREPKERCFN
jgi:5'-nucleotidase